MNTIKAVRTKILCKSNDKQSLVLHQKMETSSLMQVIFYWKEKFVWEVLYSSRQETLVKNLDSRTKSLSSRFTIFDVQSEPVSDE